jgi:predicted short-subunit dehydrogenase-like oxidoreductase (DUF2520 family)
MKIVIIGSGNVATHFGISLQEAKHEIMQVYSRSESSAKSLAKKLNCSFTTSISDITAHAEFYLVALSDEAIKPFLKKFEIRNRLIVHTSGSTPLAVFGNKFSQCGVLYPVQTFSKTRKIDFRKVPVCIEGNNDFSKKKIKSIARTLTRQIHFVDSSKRKTIHLAAVFANNFSNHCFVIAEKILSNKNVPFDILRPLIHETAEKVQFDSPADMQTGPAKRGDLSIQEEHVLMLAKRKEFLKIYKLISESISEMSGIRL